MGKIARSTQEKPPGSRMRVLRSLSSVRVIDSVCRLGADDKETENVFPAFRVAAVVAGTFGIRSNIGAGLAIPGSLVIGNACECYCCRHHTDQGDRCLYFDFEAAFLEDVRAALGLRGTGERFRRGLLPPSLQSVAMACVAESIATGHSRTALEEAAFEMAAAGLAATHATQHVGRRCSFEDERRIERAVRYIEAHFREPCTLAHLAAGAAMSRYHFLRMFRRITGQTPHRHVLVTRLRHAARRLRTTSDRVIDIAADTGFDDVSNFNAQFMRAFGSSPLQFRTAQRRLEPRQVALTARVGQPGPTSS